MHLIKFRRELAKKTKKNDDASLFTAEVKISAQDYNQ